MQIEENRDLSDKRPKENAKEPFFAFSEEKEMLDEVDEAGNPTGRAFPRGFVHAEGIRHRTSHVWIARQKAGELQILLQKRSGVKDSFPGCYDISSAGHIPSGEDFLPSALRELKEELGLEARAEDLIFCTRMRFFYDGSFYGRRFVDDQVTSVYLLFCGLDEDAFTVEESEISSVEWFTAADVLRLVAQYPPDGTGKFPHCIIKDEIDAVCRKCEEILSGDNK